MFAGVQQVMAHDALNIEVPPRLEDVFNGRRMLMLVCEDMDLVHRTLAALVDTECCEQLDIVRLLDDINEIRVTIQQGSPFTLCDCLPSSVCTKCEGRKWISGTQYLLESRLEPKSLLPD